MIETIIGNAQSELGQNGKLGKENKEGIGISPIATNTGKIRLNILFLISFKWFLLISFIILVYTTNLISTEENLIKNLKENLTDYYSYYIGYLMIDNGFLNSVNWLITNTELAEHWEKGAIQIGFKNELNTPQSIQYLILTVWFIFSSIYSFALYTQATAQKALHSMGNHKQFIPLWAVFYWLKRAKNGYIYTKPIEGENMRILGGGNAKNLLNLFKKRNLVSTTQKVEILQEYKTILFGYYDFYKMSIEIEQKRDNVKEDIKTINEDKKEDINEKIEEIRKNIEDNELL